MDDTLLRRAEDLARRAGRTGSVTQTNFLTPAEAYALGQWTARGTDCAAVFSGGYDGAERRCCFFLPAWMDPAELDPAEYICAIELTARFGSPGHRDVLGAALALGIERDRLGDILVEGERAWLFCLPPVKAHLLLSLDRVGRWGVKAREVPLAEVPVPAREVAELRFTVQSPRLDAVCAGMFRVSRGTAAEAIAQGLVSLNYSECLKGDAPVRAGDVISLRGKGKGTVAEVGEDRTRKGRRFVRAELLK